MSLRTSFQKLIRRDPERPSLRERAADLRGSLSRRTVVAGTVAVAVPLPALAASAQPERAEHRARLLAAYAEDRASRPVGSNADCNSVEEKAAGLVQDRCWKLAKEVIALPPLMSPDGLALTALAAAILLEADLTDDDPTDMAAVFLTRAVLAFTGTAPPPGFVGFGDEADHSERDDALHDGEGSLPAWAIAAVQDKATRR